MSTGNDGTVNIYNVIDYSPSTSLNLTTNLNSPNPILSAAASNNANDTN